MNGMKSGLRRVLAIALGSGIALFLVGATVPHTYAAKYPTPNVEQLLTGGFWGPLVNCTGIQNIKGFNGTDTIVNKSQTAIYVDGEPTSAPLDPCQSLCDIVEALQRLLYFALTILIYVLLPVMVFVGGFLILIGGGNPAQRATGTKTIVSAVIGLAIAMSAFLIVNTFLWLVFASAGDTSYTYTGDALSGQNTANGNSIKTTKATRVTWPNITCQPGAYQEFVPNPSAPPPSNTPLPGQGLEPR
jgi:hypothetical protein